MTAPVRLQRRRTRGYDMQAESIAVNGLPAVYVGRPTMWGNRWLIGTWSNRLGRHVRTIQEAVDLYRELAWPEEHHKAWVRENLRGRNLACWCQLPKLGYPDHCHAAVLLEMANK